jgi:hypothetical protein
MSETEKQKAKKNAAREDRAAFLNLWLEARLARLGHGLRQQAFALGALSGQLARPAHRLGALARTLFGRLFVVISALHFAESPFPLHFLFERLQRLIDVVIANENLNQDPSSG